MIKFGTDGWRAIMAADFTFSNVAKVAAAIAHYLTSHKILERGIVIGFDPRFLSEEFANQIVAVMNEAGINCFMPERDTPTPIIAYSILNLKAAGAVMLTASHNPPEYQGIKFIPEYAGPAFQEITSEIEKNLTLDNNLKAKKVGQLKKIDPLPAYLEHLDELIDFEIIQKRGLKVVFDPLFGAGRKYLAEILTVKEIDFEIIHGERDVLFGGSLPEPTEERLGLLSKRVVESKADLGIGLDGDADRFGVIDEKGNFLGANEIIPLLCYYLVKERKRSGSVVRSVATTHLIDRVAEKFSLKVHETPVGFKHVAKIMLEEEVVIGGEESGGLSIGGHIPEKDGLLANLLVMEMLSSLTRPLSDLMAELYHEFGQSFNRRSSLKLDPKTKDALMKSLLATPPKKVGKRSVTHVNTMDGVKLIFDDLSWLLIRPSGTEPIVRLYVEAPSLAIIEEIKKDFLEIVK